MKMQKLELQMGKLFRTILWLVLLAVLVSFAILLPDLGFVVLSLTAIALIGITTVVLLCLSRSSTFRVSSYMSSRPTNTMVMESSRTPFLPAEQPRHEEPPSPQLVTTTLIVANSSYMSIDEARSRSQVRLSFLDTLKVFLTAIVVMHHVCCAFDGAGCWYYEIGNYLNPFQVFSQTFKVINQSYFMCLFFFISGYFTPSSYAKKGRREFLKDKFKRLGLPFLFMTLVIYPLLNLLVRIVACGNAQDYSYFPNSGPTWFLAWLLFFNVAYASMGEAGHAQQVRLPSLKVLLVSGAVLSAGQFGLIASGMVIFIFMPITVGSLPFDVAFFTAGIFAKQGDWLSSGLDNLSMTARVVSIVMSIGYIIGVFATFLVTYLNGGGGYMPSRDSGNDANDERGRGFNTSILVLNLLSGIFTVTFSLNVLLFFRRYFNFESARTKFFANAAYALYLVHPVVVVLFTWSYVAMLNARSSDTVVFALNSTRSSSHLTNDSLVWSGWIYTSAMSLFVGWPVASYLRSLPGLSNIL